jgi:RimJ/RimL family protein N-acetyltransferase
MMPPLKPGAVLGKFHGPIIETERLILRPWQAADIAANTQMLSDPGTARFITPDRKAVTEELMGWRNAAVISGHWALYGFGMFAVEEKSSGQYAGRVGPWFPPTWPGFEVGWGIARELRGQGYAVEAARAANGWRDTRPHLAHLQVVHPEDVPRFRELGATANLQPLWACHEPQLDDLCTPFLGGELGGWQYPFGDLLRAGATLCAGSDWPVSSPNPIEGIHVAVNRVAPGAAGAYEPFLPGQSLDLTAALAAYTAGSAYVNFRDADTGAIRAGALADLALLDRDPYALPTEEIATTTVLGTWVSGERVHEA